MSHDPTESSLGVIVLVFCSLDMPIHDPVISVFLIFQISIVGSVFDKRVLRSVSISFWTAGQEVQLDPVFVFFERVGKFPVRVVASLPAAAFRWIGVVKEDTVLSG